MSPFPGHVSLSAYCVAVGIWWLLNASRRRATAKKYCLPYRSSSWYLCQGFPNTPLEPFLLFVALLTNIGYDMYASFVHPNGFHWHFMQHVPIYSTAAMTCVVQMLQFRYRGTFPRGFDYMFLMATHFVNVVIIYHHLYGRPPLDVTCHMQLVYISAILVAAMFLEMRDSDQPLFANVRGIIMIVLGLNLGRTGFLLYPPMGKEYVIDQHSHRSIAFANFLFGSEMLLALSTSLVFNFLSLRYFCCDSLYKQVMRRQQEQQQQAERDKLHCRKCYSSSSSSGNMPSYLAPEYYQGLKSSNNTAIISNGKAIS